MTKYHIELYRSLL